MPHATLPDMHAPRLAWALWYAAHGWPVFPCQGKVPMTSHGLHDATREPATITQWWHHSPAANIGSPAGYQWWALDVDPRAGGDSTLFALQQRYGFLPHTLLSHTGGGGEHYLWQMPPGGVINKADVGTGIDVQGFGSYLILPPSLHPDTGNTYIWDLVDGPDDIDPQPAPDWLLHLVTRPPQTGVPPSPQAPIPSGQRDDTLARMIVRMYRAGLTPDAIRAAIEIENQRCTPPMTAAEIDRLLHNRHQYTPDPVFLTGGTRPLHGTPPLGWGMAGSVPPPAPAPPDWRAHLASKKTGGLVQDVRNLSLILEYHEFYRGQFWWDDVSSRPMLGSQRVDDDTLVSIGRWLGTEESLSVTNVRLLERCVLSRCRANRRDLLQQWLTELDPWDQVPRLTMWLHDLAGVDASHYGQEVSRLLPISMVARALDPGCICRYVVILEGPEECGKSTLVQELASERWYVALSKGLDTKDSHMMLQGAWVAEMAELDSLSRTEETALKAFLTMRQDSYIPKYSNFRESHLRRAIFVGTTNEESYLKGQTGNTRFLPVKVTQPIDIEGFRFIREQLFAEALVAYHATPTWWLMAPEAAEGAKEEREQRRLMNVYEAPLDEWLEVTRFSAGYQHNMAATFTPDETSWPEIAQYFLGLKTAAEWKDINLQKQIAQALKTLGWQTRLKKRSGHVSRVWVKT